MTILEVTRDGATACLTMNAPERLNALSDEMLAALQTTLDDIADTPEIRVVSLAGRGKAFCAGHDLKQMTALRQAEDGGAAGFRDLFERCSRVMARIQSMPQPVIAQVHGIATAAGCQLVATCDLAVAAEGTRFGVNGVNIGLFCSTPMVALTRNIPTKMAFEMLTTGRFLLASEAQHQGLINRTAPAEELGEDTRALAQSIAQKLPAAVRIGKAAFYAQSHMTTAQAYAFTGDVMVENMALDATAEGIDAFLTNRLPDWPT